LFTPRVVVFTELCALTPNCTTCNGHNLFQPNRQKQVLTGIGWRRKPGSLAGGRVG
jgi:hypothetical protein